MLLERFPFDLILSHRDAQNDVGPSNPNHQFLRKVNWRPSQSKVKSEPVVSRTIQ